RSGTTTRSPERKVSCPSGSPQAFPEVVAPALWKTREPRGTSKHIPVRGRRGVEADDVGDAEAVLRASGDLDGIARLHLAFARHGEVEPAAAALHEFLDHVRSP